MISYRNVLDTYKNQANNSHFKNWYRSEKKFQSNYLTRNPPCTDFSSACIQAASKRASAMLDFLERIGEQIEGKGYSYKDCAEQHRRGCRFTTASHATKQSSPVTFPRSSLLLITIGVLYFEIAFCRGAHSPIDLCCSAILLVLFQTSSVLR